VRKLISIGLILALLVTFLVPVAVGADQNCTECGVDGPCPAPIPPCTTDTAGGAILWTLLGTSYIMGRAVGDTTEHIAGTLGCYVDELARPVGGVLYALMNGLGGLLGGLGEMIGMQDIFDPLAGMLTGIADAMEEFLS
jgi:hypothetical protein